MLVHEQGDTEVTVISRCRTPASGPSCVMWFCAGALVVTSACGKPSPVDPATDADLDADVDVDSDADGDDVRDADMVEEDGDTIVDGDPDEIGDGDVDLDVPEPDCSCPAPFADCALIPEVAFSYWDDSMATQLLQAIACAETSLKIAVYDINSPCIVDALLAATTANPDLEVQVVTEFENCGRVDDELVCELSRLEEAGVGEIILDSRASYLMHTKFMVIDGTQAVVSTANWTDNGLCDEFNGSMLIEEQALVDALDDEFDRFFLDGLFGAPPWSEPISESGIDLYFSPSGEDWQDELIRRLGEAEGAIRFMVFAFTREDIAQAMIDAANRGVDVRGVIANRFFTSRYSAVTLMVDAGLDVRVAEVHHKTTLIDSGDGQVTLVTGSGNLSTAARDHNNEVVMFIDDRDAVFDAFSIEFERVWSLSEVRTLEE